MQSRLYLRLSALGTSGRLALLPCGIVVEGSLTGFPADCRRHHSGRVSSNSPSFNVNRLQEMCDLPSAARLDRRNLGLRNSVLPRKDALLLLRREDVQHAFGRNLCPGARFAFLSVPSISSKCVSVVVRIRPEIQMLWIDTDSIVASVANQHSLGDVPIGSHTPRNPVGGKRLSMPSL